MDRRESGFVAIAIIIVIVGIIVIPTLFQRPDIYHSSHKLTISWEPLQNTEYRFSFTVDLFNSENEAMEKENFTASAGVGIGPNLWPYIFEFEFDSRYDFTWARIRVAKLLNDEAADYPLLDEQTNICKLELGIEQAFNMVGLDFAILFERT